MALWGMKDAIAQSNTAAASIVVHGANSTVIGTNTKFLADLKATNFVSVNGKDYLVTSVQNDTTLNVVAALGKAVTNASSNSSYVLSTKPIYVAASEVGGDSAHIYGVDTVEIGINDPDAKAVSHAGWVRRTVGTGGRAGRVQYETLVAASSISGDAENVVFPNT